MKIIVGGDFSTFGNECVLNPFPQNVSDLFKSADVSVVNLESPVAGSGDKPIKKAGPNIKMSATAIHYLKESGINLVTLANNHFYDYGDNGVYKTIDVLCRENIAFVGGGRCKEEYSQCYELNDNIVILNYCEVEFSVNKNIGSNPLNLISVYHDITEAVKKGKFIIVIVHGGHETYNLPSPRMQEMYRFFIELGAKIVINNHQHCYSGYEKYLEGYIFYGLGNLFFPPISKNCSFSWFVGYLVSLSIDQGRLVDFQIIPYQQSTTKSKQVLLLNEQETLKFKEDISSLNNIITTQGSLESNFEKYVLDKLKNNIYTKLSPFTSTVALALSRRGLLPFFMGEKRRLRVLNLFRCESHRESCIFLLK